MILAEKIIKGGERFIEKKDGLYEVINIKYAASCFQI